MKGTISGKTVSLNEILMELYVEKEGGDKSTADSPYKNFVKDNTKKLKDIFKAMGCDIEQFKNEKDRYDLPIVVAEVFKVYISEESSKGSYISKLKNKKFLDITIEEKVDFINKIIDKIKEKYKDDNNKTQVYKELEDLQNTWIAEANYSEDVKKEILETEIYTNLIIESAMIQVGSISELDGLITVDNNMVNNLDKDNRINDYDKDNVDYRLKLSQKDRLELLKYLRCFIINNIKEWKNIVDIACELREDNMIESALGNEGVLSSKELLELSIQEYEDEIKENMKPKIVVKHNPEEMKKIIDEIRFDFNKKKK